MEASQHYALRDEQEKYFSQMKGQMLANRHLMKCVRFDVSNTLITQNVSLLSLESCSKYAVLSDLSRRKSQQLNAFRENLRNRAEEDQENRK